MNKIVAGMMALVPAFAYAQLTAGNPLADTLIFLKNILDFLIPFLMTLAIVVFFWGLVKYILNASDEAAKESGKTLMIWGMIALFVMVAFWGIIAYVQESFGVTDAAIETATQPDIITPFAAP
jgi:hypothetical protein